MLLNILFLFMAQVDAMKEACRRVNVNLPVMDKSELLKQRCSSHCHLVQTMCEISISASVIMRSTL